MIGGGEDEVGGRSEIMTNMKYEYRVSSTQFADPLSRKKLRRFLSIQGNVVALLSFESLSCSTIGVNARTWTE